MDRHQVRYTLLKLTGLVLIATTWVFWSFVYGTRPETPDADALTTLVRLPASLPGVFTPEVKSVGPIRMDVHKLGCWDQAGSQLIDVSARWVRLTGKTCDSGTRAETVTVRNLSNGYVATVFAAAPGELTTDFIPLQVGRNEILVRIEQGADKDSDVSLENLFTFVRP
ncbi:MAG: hypothetical protein AB7G93_04085 [Bdellovibrionales bacterium]